MTNKAEGFVDGRCELLMLLGLGQGSRENKQKNYEAERGNDCPHVPTHSFLAGQIFPCRRNRKP